MKYSCCALILPAATAVALPPQRPFALHDITPQPADSSRLPLVIWHGLGDRYDSGGLQYVGEYLNTTIGPTYTYNIRLDDDGGADQSATYFGNLTDQLQTVCDRISEDPILGQAKGVNAIGFSQGGQFMRAYVEKCNNPPVKTLVTFGSQHNGISEFENCSEGSWNPWICMTWEGLLKTQTWTPFVQSKLVPAQYFRDPEDLENYLEHSNFLADVNNERAVKNATYKDNVKKLERFIMYMFSDDTVVVPKETAHFDNVVGSGDEAEVIKLRDRELYKEDWLGLKDLDKRGKLEFKVAEGGHMQINDELLRDVFEIMYDKMNSRI